MSVDSTSERELRSEQRQGSQAVSPATNQHKSQVANTATKQTVQGPRAATTKQTSEGASTATTNRRGRATYNPSQKRRKVEVPLDQKEQWDLADVVAVTGLSATTINRFRDRGEFPRERRIGRRVFWKPEDIRNWLEAVSR
ncbi:MAG: helix-turn-helix transcriptional regulator [Planctomycetota bacterium]